MCGWFAPGDMCGWYFRDSDVQSTSQQNTATFTSGTIASLALVPSRERVERLEEQVRTLIMKDAQHSLVDQENQRFRSQVAEQQRMIAVLEMKVAELHTSYGNP